MRRPHSLREVADWTDSHHSFHRHLADFLDQFYLEPRPTMIVEEPVLLRGKFQEGDIADAYLAATAVYLARRIHVTPSAWVWNECRKLTSPWFASRGAALRATLIAESPAPFRERNLFVSENALSRA